MRVYPNQRWLLKKRKGIETVGRDEPDTTTAVASGERGQESYQVLVLIININSAAMSLRVWVATNMVRGGYYIK